MIRATAAKPRYETNRCPANRAQILHRAAVGPVILAEAGTSWAKKS